MPRLTLRVAPKFLLVVAVLIPALVGLSWIGIHGSNVLKGKVNGLYRDNLQVTNQTDQLARDLGHAAVVSLQEVVNTDQATTARLSADLTQANEPQVASDLQRLVKLHAHDPVSQRLRVRALVTDWHEFLALSRSGAFDHLGPGLQRFDAVVANRVGGLFSSMDRETAALVTSELADAGRARAAAIGSQQSSQELMLWVMAACLIVVLGAVFLMIRDVVPRVREYSAFARKVADDDLTGRLRPRGGDELTALAVALNEMVDRREALRISTARQAEFSAAMQLTASETEAQELLRRHLERAVPASEVVVLARNNSDDRLEAVTRLDHDPELAARLIDAKPRSCLAVRFAQSQEQGAELDPLVRCDVCGTRPGRSTCEPLTVSGQVIGSVLLIRGQPAQESDLERIRESVAQASPVLGNLRNLALAERRAATDSLSGLPNKRAAEDNLARMAAQASRTASPLAAVLLDLDHFKQINDFHGHHKGDEVIAIVGATLRSSLRECDFVARYGGEEFLILLPDTGADGAEVIAEKVREAISELDVFGIDLPVTASVGVAIFPADAKDTNTLLRHADQALYAAKRAGRNRVEAFTRAAALDLP